MNFPPGTVGYNARERFDKIRYDLWYSQKPLVTTNVSLLPNKCNLRSSH